MKRIQRHRTKGWTMPEDAVYVGRPSAWGNSWVVRQMREVYPGYIAYLPFPDAYVVERVDKRGHPTGVLLGGFAGSAEATLTAVEMYRRSIAAHLLTPDGADDVRDWLRPLYGKDLACWCAEGAPCHADALLDLLRELA